MQTYLKLFGQESLGRPELEMQNEIEKLKKKLQKMMIEGGLPDIQAALIFTSDDIDIQIGDDETPPAPTLYINKLKEFIRKTAKTKPVSLSKIEEIQQVLSSE